MNIEDLVVKHAGWIRRKARRYYADEFDADDLASETIYKCLSQARKFNPGMSFKPCTALSFKKSSASEKPFIL